MSGEAGGAGRLPITSAFQWVGLGLGPALALILYGWLPGAEAGGLSAPGRATAAVAVWMACWWLTEAVPLAATALLPVVLFPLLGVASPSEATAPFGNELLFLFMGGFILGLGIQRWGLHRRVALLTVLAVGTEPVRLIGGFMLATALLSMWISNTATVILMLPIGLSVLEMLRERWDGERYRAALENFGVALLLGIAYAASIGGVGTLIGTPPNLLLASFVKARYALDLSMLDWLLVGLPLVVVFLPLVWLYLTRVAFPVRLRTMPGQRDLFVDELRKLGPLTPGERRVGVIFGLTALGWILRPKLVEWTGIGGLSDAVIAMLGALALFVTPVDIRTRSFAMDWETARKLPWDILILFGGGLSLAAAIARHGVDSWIASGASVLAGTPTWVALLAVSAVVIFLTEITSNTAVTATLLPVVAAAASATGVPAGMLLVAVTVSASCAFMLPVATPPNAIVFASRHVRISHMARAGLGLNAIAIGLVSLVAYIAGETVITIPP